MKPTPTLVIACIVLAAFGLGVIVGSIFSRKTTPVTAILSEPVATEPAVHSDGPATQPTVPTTDNPSVRSLPACVDVRSAGSLEGKNGCVAGLVLRVYSSHAGNTFLDFCEDYRACPFTSVIFASDKSKFGDLDSLQGKRVEIRGKIVTFRGRAEIVVNDPRQVRGAP